MIARRKLLRVVFTLYFAALVSPPLLANQPGNNWPLESLALLSGPHYEGLVLAESKSQLEFAEIVRPPGKAMYAVVRAIPHSDIAELKQLDPEQRVAAVEWFERFRRRADFAATIGEKLQLTRLRIEGELGWQYTGKWFDLASTADEASTRQVIVRLEQLFLAFQHILPPRRPQIEVPRVLIYGHRDEYQDRLRSWGLAVENPAFYAKTQRTIVASCNLGQIAKQATQATREMKEQEDRLRQRNTEYNTVLADLAERLRGQGFTQEEIATEVRTRRSQWETEQADARQRLAELRRRNEKRLKDAAAVFYRRLAHEAFHAYVESYVLLDEKERMPRWLNEGLAQVFEAAPLDVDRFRIDAADPERTAALIADLKSQRPLRLSQVLRAEEEEFLKVHDREEIDRLYLYSWGLTWQLVFADLNVPASQLDDYLAVQNNSGDAVRRFEKLVGEPLPEWERKWRAAWK